MARMLLPGEPAPWFHAPALDGNPRFAFGTGKLGELAAYTSAVVLAMIALLIGYESVERLLHPVPIAYGEAVAIAALGLAVNLASAWLLRDEHDHHGHRRARRSPPASGRTPARRSHRVPAGPSA